MRPLAIDLYCGLGGWTSGLIAAGWDVIGFDIEQHAYDGERYPAQLVIQDVLTLHGSQFKTADLIVGSSPCTAYSYMAMPWSLAKAKAAAIRADETGEALRLLNELFEAQFRIQREACEAAGRHIPMVVENVRGAIPWVGRSRANFGSYHLWGDVPALMPSVSGRMKTPVSAAPRMWADRHVSPDNPMAHAMHLPIRDEEGRKVPGFRFDGSGRSFQSESVDRHVAEGRKHRGDWFRDPDCPTRQGGMVKAIAEGRKGAGAGAEWFDQNLCVKSSRSPARKAASAKIAKIPRALSEWIGRCYLPAESEAA